MKLIMEDYTFFCVLFIYVLRATKIPGLSPRMIKYRNTLKAVFDLGVN